MSLKDAVNAEVEAFEKEILDLKNEKELNDDFIRFELAAAQKEWQKKKLLSFQEDFLASEVFFETLNGAEVIVVDNFVLYEAKDPNFAKYGLFRPYTKGARFLITLNADPRGYKAYIVNFFLVKNPKDIARAIIKSQGQKDFLSDSSALLAHLSDNYASWPEYPVNYSWALLRERGYDHPF